MLFVEAEWYGSLNSYMEAAYDCMLPQTRGGGAMPDAAHRG